MTDKERKQECLDAEYKKISIDANSRGNRYSQLREKLIIRHFLIKLLVFVVVVWVIFTYIFGVRKVSGETMYPALRDGDLVLFYRLENDYNIDDAVTLRKNGTTYYGRIVAQGGDIVDMNEDGELLVNGNIQQENIFFVTEPQDGSITYPYTVEQGCFFILCDNRTVGSDSRTYGAVSQNDLDGSIVTVLRHRGI